MAGRVNGNGMGGRKKSGRKAEGGGRERKGAEGSGRERKGAEWGGHLLDSLPEGLDILGAKTYHTGMIPLLVNRPDVAKKRRKAKLEIRRNPDGRSSIVLIGGNGEEIMSSGFYSKAPNARRAASRIAEMVFVVVDTTAKGHGHKPAGDMGDACG